MRFLHSLCFMLPVLGSFGILSEPVLAERQPVNIRIFCQFSGGNGSERRRIKLTKSGETSSVKIPGVFDARSLSWRIPGKYIDLITAYCLRFQKHASLVRVTGSDSGVWEWAARRYPVTGDWSNTLILSPSDFWGKKPGDVQPGPGGIPVDMPFLFADSPLLREDLGELLDRFPQVLVHEKFRMFVLETGLLAAGMKDFGDARRLIRKFREYILSAGTVFGKETWVTGDNIIPLALLLLSEVLTRKLISDMDVLEEAAIGNERLLKFLSPEEEYYLVSFVAAYRYLKVLYHDSVAGNRCHPAGAENSECAGSLKR